MAVSRVREDVREQMDLPVDYGALVLEVVPGSAADKAGIEVEDVVISVNDEKTRNAAELRNAIGLMNEGDKVTLTVIRGGKEKRIEASLGSRSSTQAQRRLSASQEALHPGLEGAEFEEQDGSQPNAGVRGVRVASVAPGSPAAQRGLREGDIITRVNRIPVSTLAEFRDAAGEDSGQLMMTILRDGARQLLMIN
jgi:serine protease Do/serine protease DegQ